MGAQWNKKKGYFLESRCMCGAQVDLGVKEIPKVEAMKAHTSSEPLLESLGSRRICTSFVPETMKSSCNPCQWDARSTRRNITPPWPIVPKRLWHQHCCCTWQRFLELVQATRVCEDD